MPACLSFALPSIRAESFPGELRGARMKDKNVVRTVFSPDVNQPRFSLAR